MPQILAKKCLKFEPDQIKTHRSASTQTSIDLVGPPCKFYCSSKWFVPNPIPFIPWTHQVRLRCLTDRWRQLNWCNTLSTTDVHQLHHFAGRIPSSFLFRWRRGHWGTYQRCVWGGRLISPNPDRSERNGPNFVNPPCLPKAAQKFALICIKLRYYGKINLICIKLRNYGKITVKVL
jgi:hypothetical protein